MSIHRFPPAGGWQAASGPMTPNPESREETDRAALLAATLAAHGTALDLAARITDNQGVPLTGDLLRSVVSDWLREHGVDPDTAESIPGPGLIPHLSTTMPGVTRATDPTPPAGLGLDESRRWAAQWALTVQARLTAPHRDVMFHGVPKAQADGRNAVTIETVPPVHAGGRVLCDLANVRDPGGEFGWGYSGAGPTSLATSLLVAALGGGATCPVCLGSGRVTWLTAGPDQPVPWQPAPDAPAAAPEPAAGRWLDEDPPATIVRCDYCDGNGLGVRPGVAQRLRDDLVTSRWRQDAGWYITRGELLHWTERQRVDTRLAVAATWIGGTP